MSGRFALLVAFCALSFAPLAQAEDYPAGSSGGVVTIGWDYPQVVGTSCTNCNSANGFFKLKRGAGDRADGGWIKATVVAGTPPFRTELPGTAGTINFPVAVQYAAGFWTGVPRQVRDKLNARLTLTTKPYWDALNRIQPVRNVLTTSFGLYEGAAGSTFRIHPWSRLHWVHQVAYLKVEIWLDPSVADVMSTGVYTVDYRAAEAQQTVGSSTPTVFGRDFFGFQTMKAPYATVGPYVLPIAILYRPPGSQSWSKMTAAAGIGSGVSLYEGTATSIAATESWGLGPIGGTSPTSIVTREAGGGVAQHINLTTSSTIRTNNPFGPGSGDVLVAIVRPTFNLYRAQADRDAVLIQQDPNLENKVRAVMMGALQNPPPGSFAALLSAAEKAELMALDPLLADPRAPLPPSRYARVRRSEVDPGCGCARGAGDGVQVVTGTELVRALSQGTATTSTDTMTLPLSRVGALIGGALGVPLPVPDLTRTRTETTTTTIESRSVRTRQFSDSILMEYELADSDPNKHLCADIYYDKLFGTFAFQDCTPETALLNAPLANLGMTSRPLTGIAAMAGTKPGTFAVAWALAPAGSGGGVATVTPLDVSRPSMTVGVMSTTGNVVLRNLAPGTYTVAYRQQYSTLTVDATGRASLGAGEAPTIAKQVTKIAFGQPVLTAAAVQAIATRTAAPAIVNVYSGKCADVADGSVNDQANVQQYTCHRGPNQSWSVRPLGAEFQIVSQNSGRCLDVAGGSTADSANVQQFGCHQGPNQRWRLVPVTQDVYQIVSFVSGKCLDVAGGSTADSANIQQFTCHGGPNQQWRIVGIGELVTPLDRRF